LPMIYQVVGYSVLGDAGATFSQAEVCTALEYAASGFIVLLHMNHPEGQTAEGIIDVIPVLKQKGYRFVKLSDLSFE
jgi:peptidoglycan/xylan/chitin deacetylase (PgdA/CDA1 family)